MNVPILTLPRAVPDQRERPPQVNIPQTKIDRDRLAAAVRAYVAAAGPVPPLPIDELRTHADRLVARTGIEPVYRDYTAVLVNNEAWRDSLAGIPYDRRLLLLPKCLRYEAKCPAPFDEFGLLCKRCGLCSIQDLQDEAERLGYAVLVAEGSAIVTAIIQTGKIEAIVGVSCLSVLEKAFPHMEAAAIPGIAIPLLQDDCVDTGVDLDWVWDVVHLTSDDRTYRLDLDGVRSQVESWFTPAELDRHRHLGPSANETDRLAREWLAKSGKRWRPFLTACAYIALRRDAAQAIPDALRRVAIAVECFHKASLIHDDIEDGDRKRYGEDTLHVQYGVPVALNIGDYLLGEGYRLLAEIDAPADVRAELLRLAAIGHRTLSDGQGDELSWMVNRKPLSSLQVLDIFRRKTAPAFEVALRLGAVFAGADLAVHDIIARYSEALGIAYQIRDDLDDWTVEAPGDRRIVAPSIVLAVALERARTRDAEAAARVDAAWRASDAATDVHNLDEVMRRVGATDRCRQLFESYKEEAVRSLAALDNASLKGLLRRVVGKIFNDIELKGWCSEFEARNAAGRASGAEAVV